jgi:hypothetical protein
LEDEFQLNNGYFQGLCSFTILIYQRVNYGLLWLNYGYIMGYVIWISWDKIWKKKESCDLMGTKMGMNNH